MTKPWTPLATGRLKRVIAYRLARFMEENELSKTAMAKRMQTSRSLDRLLDPANPSITLQTMTVQRVFWVRT